MNILYIALFLCVVCHVFASESGTSGSVSKQETSLVLVEDHIASSPVARSFVGAVERGDVRGAYNIFNSGSDGLKEYCGYHLVSLGNHVFVKLFNGAGDYKAWMLRMILVYAGQALFDAVSAEIKPTDYILSHVGYSADLACKPDKLLHLLERITDKGYQEWAVRRGVDALLCVNKPEYLDPLFSTLQNEPSLDPNLTNAAIQRAFRTASFYTDDRTLYAKRFFDHPAVSAEHYSNALRYSYRSKDPKHVLFHWLLTRADNQDLEEARSDDLFSEQSPGFRDAVNNVLHPVGPGARIGRRHRKRVVILADAFDDLVPTVLLGLIAAYFDWQLNLF